MKVSEMIVICLLISALALLFIFYYQTKTEANYAALHPYTFSVEKLSEKYGEDIDCYCNAGKYIMNKSGVWRRYG